VTEVGPDEIGDAFLKMLFFCCHPTIPRESQLVLALKTLCGFDVREIAQRLFTSPANVSKRLTRARNTLKLRTPETDDGTDTSSSRLDGVHQVLYALFSEGHLSTRVAFSLRTDLCREAIRLGELLAESSTGATPETDALLALMHLHLARASARLDGSGGLVLLEDQDRSLWDRKLIETGLGWLERSARGDRYSRYHAEAAIAAEHCLAPSLADTNWDNIVRQYDLLLAVAPTAIFELHRAVAVAQVKGSAEALKILHGLVPPAWLAGSYLWFATWADLHFRNGDAERGNSYAARAHQSAPSAAIQQLLGQRFAHYTRPPGAE
jgi:RNA polymerase sigma-70 factor (ECF subfamily)